MKVENSRTPTPPATSSASGGKAARAAETGSTARSRSAQASSPATKTRDPQSATPQISARGKEMAQVRAAADAAPDVRQDRVDELKAQIAGGNYQVDPRAVAEALVNDHLAMAGAGA